jgi:hypothetical protein
MTGTAGSGVRGLFFTSTVGLACVLGIALGIALAAMFGVGIVHSLHQAVILWVMCTILLTAMLQVTNNVTVTSEGFLLNSLGRKVWIPWTNVSRIDAGKLGAKFIFKEPQAIGSKPMSKYAFASLDPMWRKRPTVLAILAGLALSQSGSRAVEE